MRRIGQDALLHCTSLGELHTPPTLLYIDKRAFAGCAQLYRLVRLGRKTTCFFVAPDSFVKDDIACRLEKRGHLFKPEDFPVTRELLYAMLPPGAAQRLDAHEKQREGKEGIETGAYLVDVNQWPDSGCSAAGPYWPCQSTRATAISFNHGRAAVGLEYLLAQGFHVFPEIHGGRPAQILPLVEGLKTDKIIALSGNSMSLPAFTAWMAYVFFDSMLYQAKKADKDKNGADKEMERAFCEAMKDDITAKNEVLAFCEMNPPDQRYARKQCIDWAAFKQKHGRRTEIIDRSKCTPMWEGEFLKWAENVKALPEAEAKAWWKEPLNNPRIERDNDGYKGRLQLWVPKSVARLTDKSKFTESAAEQGSKPIKDPKAEDVNMLKHIGP